ncbi:hypothetical protein [Streptomyces sp. NPDC012756]|uniref:hypothetical protein n=1 Tax=Streptomyces sp. NPDC012756 TaxID=3364847 RepID=UPI0036B1F932
MLVATMGLGVLAAVVHVVNPDETWAAEGMDWLMIGIALAICAANTWWEAME